MTFYHTHSILYTVKTNNSNKGLRMKVTKEHYTMIKEQFTTAIDKVIAQGKLSDRKEFFKVNEEIYADYTEQRKVWDMYWASGGAEWIRKAYNGDPYASPYNDSHLETAFKKAYKEIHKESM